MLVLVYVPCKNKQEAKRIATALLKKRLIACANIFSSESIYRWDKKMQHSKESIIIAKTLEKHYHAIERTITKLHSYKCPCILKLNAEGNEKFVRWVEKEVCMISF